MSKFIIEGGRPLNGEITVAGNKNAALPIIAATVLTDDDCYLENVPDIRDVRAMLELLRGLGKTVEKVQENHFKISGSVNKTEIDPQIGGNLRASILFLSVLLARKGEVRLPPPGGCVIGRRKVDSHFDVLQAFGAKVQANDDGYTAVLPYAKPANIFLKEASVTATENAMLLAAATWGDTIIDNAAGDPHITNLGMALSQMGALIQGAGTSHMRIRGFNELKGFKLRIVPDHIEAGTLAIAAACTGGRLVIHDAYRQHLMMPAYYLQQMGVKLNFKDDSTLELKPSTLVSKAKKIQVGLWPGFPTDLMSPMIVLATQAKGTTLCHDWMYESRMFFVDKLIVMGAEITQCDPHRVLVNGPSALRGQELSSPDIRAGIALVIAALTARGPSVIDRVEIIDRGYENIMERLNALGANIRKINA